MKQPKNCMRNPFLTLEVLKTFITFAFQKENGVLKYKKEAENKEKVVFEETKSDHGGLAKSVKRYS